MTSETLASEPGVLLRAAAVRERCTIVHRAAERGLTRYFRLVPDRLDEATRRVAAITRRRYPDLAVPPHSRWRHFSAGGIAREALIAPGEGSAERTRAKIDLAVVSVLLDAGAGAGWCYREAQSGRSFARSEGLAVASLRAMQRGLFSADPTNPWRTDAAALMRLTPERLGAAFQHQTGNELLGLDRRALLLRHAGKACVSHPILFGGPARPGHLYDYWRDRGVAVSAAEILETLLSAFAPIWPAGIGLDGVPLGDCGRHPTVPGDGLVPFHKLSQWLAYSLIEPLEEGGVRIAERDALTGLAEYRNGGLFVDCGVVEPCDPGLLRWPLAVQSEPVVEWRALTVILLDHLAERVRERLGKDLSLAQVLEGGSWAAGREIAFERRSDGRAPLTIVSDGTLF